MSDCPPLIYPKVTPAIWAIIKAKVEAEMPSLAPMGDTGSGTWAGVTISWAYVASNLVLTASESYWSFLTCAAIKDHIDGLIIPLVPRAPAEPEQVDLPPELPPEVGEETPPAA